MAGASSTSSIQKSFQYDVFLSFRGEDTRTNFVDHLYDALERKSIHTFKDGERIKQGKRIDDQLISSIEDSKFFIIVFSENHASSSWCLDELVKIMECHNTMQHTAYPIFYKVEPSEVRKQHGLFGKAFSKHKNEESAGIWRKALEEAANLAGWELKNFANGHEAKLIQKIVEEISLELRSINSWVDEKLVGMESRIKHVISILESSSDEVCMIGIKGMGGGGKTTLARAIFDKICNRFDGNSFVENVREVSKDSSLGLKSLQKQVLSDVLADEGIIVNSVSEGKNLVKRRLCGRKVVVVLDDVDHIDQLEALAGAPNWFKAGSVIIITTREVQVLVAHRVKWICDVNLLSDDDAICLFSRYSFGREVPVEGYEELSAKVVRYAGGLPLTIKVLGSFLCGKDKLEWVDALERLKTIPLQETLEKLELSYIGLEEDYKEIFLDVACLLKGFEKDRAIICLESCGFHARNGLRVLEQKCLITISYGGYLRMHDHIEEMGRNIVRRQHPDEPNRHSRLWIQQEIKDVLANNLGTEAIRCIKMDAKSDIFMEGLVKMKKLRCLIVEADFDVGEIQPYFPSNLQYLIWEYYPNPSLPKDFGANNLVGLEMRCSEIEQLWEGGERKVLNKLKFIDLSDSKYLRTLDLRLITNLEKLVLESCYNLVELQMPSPCLNLKSLVVTESKLRTLDLGPTPNLELNNCHDLVQLHMPVECPRLEYVDLSRSKLTTFDVSLTPNLKKLVAEECDDLVEIRMPVKPLISLYMDNPELRTFGHSRSNLPEECHFRELSFKGDALKALQIFNQSECLGELYMFSLEIKHLPDNICWSKHLKSLQLNSCWLLQKLPEDLDRCQCLEKLILTSCTSLKEIPNSICNMKHLKYLHLPFCIRVEKLPEQLGRLQHLKELNVKCTGITHLPHTISLLKGLRIVGSRSLLQSCGFVAEIQTSETETFCYI